MLTLSLFVSAGREAEDLDTLAISDPILLPIHP